MSETMNLNYMTRISNNLMKGYGAKKAQTDTEEFREQMEAVCAQNGGILDIGSIGTVSTKDMTMEEYKQYIHDKISSFPMSATRKMESISITISDAGFEAMKNDPEYEAWVLNDLHVAFLQTNPWVPICGGGYVTIFIGATKEQCHAESWFPGYQNGNGESLFNQKSKNSFWEQRVERNKIIDAQFKAKQRKKASADRLAQTRYYAELAAKKAEYSSFLRTGDDAWQRARAAASYDANILLDQIGISGFNGQ